MAGVGSVQVFRQGRKVIRHCDIDDGEGDSESDEMFRPSRHAASSIVTDQSEKLGDQGSQAMTVGDTVRRCAYAQPILAVLATAGGVVATRAVAPS